MSTDAPAPDLPDDDDLLLEDEDLEAGAAEEPEPDPAAVLDPPDVATRLAAMDRAALTTLTTIVVGAARAAPGAPWPARLARLRAALLLHNERKLLALALLGQHEVAMATGDYATAVDAADTLWGVRELLDEPWKAHASMLMLARAQAAAGDAATAEVTLLRATEAARKLAPRGNVVPASAAVARTLTQLAELLWEEGRATEAKEWVEGAIDLAPDEETAAPARVLLARLAGR
jgi:tetratricopeptide (TPR) repeat protein